jgi:hypothetical protein
VTDQDPDPATAAFFRWQEWLAFRRHLAPRDAKTRGELYAAESMALAAAGEHDAARDAAELARAHDAAMPTEEVVNPELHEPVVEVALTPVASEAQENFAEQLEQLKRRIERLNPAQARGVLQTISALPGTLAWGRADPVRVMLVPVQVKSARRGVGIASMVTGLSGLRQIDLSQFRSMMELIQRQSGAVHDDKFVDWLKGDELP